MVSLGYLGVIDELKYKREKKGIIITFILLFFFMAYLRLSTKTDLGDLSGYINYFMDDDDSYFEPGYTFYTHVIKYLFGYSSHALVLGVAIWVVVFVSWASTICTKYINEEGQDSFPSYTNYTLCLLFFVSIYWGSFFVLQTLRIGMAMSLLYCAAAYAINGRKVPAYVITGVAMLFHTSCILFFVGLVVLSLNKTLNSLSYLLWFIAIIFARLIFANTQLIASYVESIVQTHDIFVHYEEYVGYAKYGEAHFSPQTIAYHVFGLFMLKGNLNNPYFNRSVMLYYLGLTIGSFFQFTSISMRMQWIYLNMVVFSLYYFCIDRYFSHSSKIIIISGYTIIELVMLLRQFDL